MGELQAAISKQGQFNALLASEQDAAKELGQIGVDMSLGTLITDELGEVEIAGSFLAVGVLQQRHG